MGRYSQMAHTLVPQPTPEVDQACRALEEFGLDFCVDYGTLNAVDLYCGLLEAQENDCVDDWLRWQGIKLRKRG